MATGSRLSGTNAPTTGNLPSLHEGHPDQEWNEKTSRGVEIADYPVRCCTGRCSTGGNTRANGGTARGLSRRLDHAP